MKKLTVNSFGWLVRKENDIIFMTNEEGSMVLCGFGFGSFLASDLADRKE